jgi:hypothetical protein
VLVCYSLACLSENPFSRILQRWHSSLSQGSKELLPIEQARCVPWNRSSSLGSLVFLLGAKELAWHCYSDIDSQRDTHMTQMDTSSALVLGCFHSELNMCETSELDRFTNQSTLTYPVDGTGRSSLNVSAPVMKKISKERNEISLRCLIP